MKNIIFFFILFIQLFVCGQMSVTTTAGTTNFTRNSSAGNPPPCGLNEFRIVGDSDISSGCVRLTKPNTGGSGAPVSNFGAMWACNSFDLDNSFKFTASVTFGSGTTTGDGIVFVIKTDAAANKSGGVGGNIGYHAGTIVIGESIGVEYDTYLGGPGDLASPDTCDHGQIVNDGSLTNKIGGQTCLKSDGTSINDGLAKSICIVWDALALTFRAYFEGRLIASMGDIKPYFANKDVVYWGITAGDGNGTEGNLNSHIVCNANMNISDVSLPAPSCVVVLPVELLNFKINIIDNQSNKIKWATASERENDYFTVEKSIDGNNFEFLANIEGSGNSVAEKQYEFIDDNPFSEITYYKLTQTDFNGEKKFLGIKAIENEDYEYTNVITNPFEDFCKLTLKSKTNTSKQIAICDATGKVVYNETIQLNKGINSHEIDFTQQENGIYMIMVPDENSTTWHKVVKLKN